MQASRQDRGQSGALAAEATEAGGVLARRRSRPRLTSSTRPRPHKHREDTRGGVKFLTAAQRRFRQAAKQHRGKIPKGTKL